MNPSLCLFGVMALAGAALMFHGSGVESMVHGGALLVVGGLGAALAGVESAVRHHADVLERTARAEPAPPIPCPREAPPPACEPVPMRAAHH